MGAMLNAQLDRLDGMIDKMRSEKRRILDGTRHLSNLGLKATPLNSPEHECSTQVMYLLPNEECGDPLHRTAAERHRRQNGPTHLHSMGLGALA